MQWTKTFNRKLLDENIRSILQSHNEALIALKKQRDIDRDRRLMLIRRLKKEKKSLEQKFRIVSLILLILIIISLFK